MGHRYTSSLRRGNRARISWMYSCRVSNEISQFLLSRVGLSFDDGGCDALNLRYQEKSWEVKHSVRRDKGVFVIALG